MNRVKSFYADLPVETKNVLSIFSGLILLGLIFGLTTNNFLTSGNLLTVALQTSTIAIIAIGQTYVMITTGIDLSIGSNIALCGMVAGYSMKLGLPVTVSIMLGLFTGCLIGLFNGATVVYGKLPPFIVTLGTMSISRGLALMITNGSPISGLPKSFDVIGNGSLFGVPVPIYIMLVLVVIFAFVLARTKLGSHTYAVGSNFEAARLSGINTNRTLIYIYIIGGFLAACSGIILSSRVISAQPTAGLGYELDAVAASVIGGTSTLGGEGMILGTLVGAFIIGVLRNGLNLQSVSPFTQQVVIGAVIIGAVFFDRIKRKE